MGFIYKLDFVSGKSYIGLTKRPVVQRIAQHRRDTKKPENAFLVHRAWLKYGEPKVSVICEADGEELKRAECEAIERFNTISPNGYNLVHGGDNPRWSEETKKKMSESSKGRAKSAEHRAKIGAAHRGKIVSSEARAKMVIAAAERTGRHDLSQFWAGKKQSPEHIASRVEARKAKALAKL